MTFSKIKELSANFKLISYVNSKFWQFQQYVLGVNYFKPILATSHFRAESFWHIDQRDKSHRKTPMVPCALKNSGRSIVQNISGLGNEQYNDDDCRMTLNSLTRDGSTGSGSPDGVNGGSVLGVGSASPQLAPTLNYNHHSAANSVLNGYATYGPTPPGPACHAYCTVTPAGKETSRVPILVLIKRRNSKELIKSISI